MAITVRKLKTGWAVFVDGKQESSIGSKANIKIRAENFRTITKIAKKIAKKRRKKK